MNNFSTLFKGVMVMAPS